MSARALIIATLSTSLFSACADDTTPVDAPEGYSDMGLGLVEEMKDDGQWGAATTCKPIPNLPPLNDPMIVISLDGLTLRLFDRQGSYDKTFPIGPGAIENGKSLTPVSTNRPTGLFYTRSDGPRGIDGPTPSQQVWSWNHSCKMWWKDEQGKQIPVFAGLPFIRLEGPPTLGYGIHGPIDRFTQANGGTLRRGYVSHGCIRMEAADIVEVFALIQGHRAPVLIQQAIERKDDGRAVDIAQKWIGQECQADADCNFTGGFCHMNAYSGRGFCSARCTRTCADRAGYPTTFCVADPDDTSKGMCVAKSQLVDNNCRRYDHFVTKKSVPRFGQSSVKADVCLPGTEGWMGDRCLSSSECAGGACMPVDTGEIGVCTQACSRYCPDKANHAGTFCVDASDESGLTQGMCVATCASNDDCALGTTCEVEGRYGQASTTRKVCLPY